MAPPVGTRQPVPDYGFRNPGGSLPQGTSDPRAAPGSFMQPSSSSRSFAPSNASILRTPGNSLPQSSSILRAPGSTIPPSSSIPRIPGSSLPQSSSNPTMPPSSGNPLSPLQGPNYSSPPPQMKVSPEEPSPYGVRVASPSGSIPKVRRTRPDTEEIRRMGRIHYQELYSFLRHHLAKDATGPRSNAREKLTRLSKQQFAELSTDVYDELMRRLNNAKTGARDADMPHLAVREEFHPKRNQARQKLATLPKTRFKDLSSDVFFELERRFPEYKDEFRPDANERERGSALSPSSDPEQSENIAPADAPSALRGTDMAALESTSDVVIPKKSLLVGEDIAVPYKNGKDDSDGDESRSRESLDGADNRSTMYSQASSVGTGFLNGYSGGRLGEQASPNLGGSFEAFPGGLSMEKLRSDYEFRIATLNQRITTLESQNAELRDHSSSPNGNTQRALQAAQLEKERLRQDHADQLSSFEKKLLEHQRTNDETTQKLSDAMSKMRILEEEGQSRGGETFAEQEQLVQDMRAEVESLVQEVQQLSSRNEELVAEKDQDLLVIRDLNQQIQTFKRKFEQARTELRQYKATSQLFVQPPKADEFLKPSENGVVADVNVTAFRTSIDELLAAARTTTPSHVLVAMKAVVLATTLVTDDIAKFEQTSAAQAMPAANHEQLLQLKPKISTSLNNLMTACRNYASSGGLSPVSLIDAAASHVAATVVDLVKLLGARSATQAEKEQYEAHFSGNAMPAGGLKPLHIGTAGLGPTKSSHSPSSDQGHGLDLMKTPYSAADISLNRLSPGSAKTAGAGVFGRYSPVSYNPSAGSGRKVSTGDVSWSMSGTSGVGGISRSGSSGSNSSSQHEGNTSGNSGGQGAGSGSGSGNGNASFEIPNLPRTHLDSAKREWANSRVTSMASSYGAARNSRYASTSLGNRASLAQGARKSSLDSETEDNWAELRNYIEVQTEAIVHSIQALLSAIREGAQGVQLNENLVQITTIASSIVVISRDNLPSESHGVLDQLQADCERLAEMQTSSTFDKSAKSAMASASYGVAKGLKELNGLLNSADAGASSRRAGGSSSAIRAGAMGGGSPRPEDYENDVVEDLS